MACIKLLYAFYFYAIVVELWQRNAWVGWFKFLYVHVQLFIHQPEPDEYCFWQSSSLNAPSFIAMLISSQINKSRLSLSAHIVKFAVSGILIAKGRIKSEIVVIQHTFAYLINVGFWGMRTCAVKQTGKMWWVFHLASCSLPCLIFFYCRHTLFDLKGKWPAWHRICDTSTNSRAVSM